MTGRRIALMIFCACLASGLAPAQALDADKRELFDLWDYDGDGVITGDEYKAGGDAPRHYDPNKDGTLTLDEYAGYYGERRAGGQEEVAGETAMQGPLPATLPSATYSCLHIYYDYANKRTMFDMMGQVSTFADGSYRWIDTAPGRYGYDGTGPVTWSGGAFAELGIVESGLEWKGEELMLRIVFQATAQKTLTYNCYLPS